MRSQDGVVVVEDSKRAEVGSNVSTTLPRTPRALLKLNIHVYHPGQRVEFALAKHGRLRGVVERPPSIAWVTQTG